MSKQSKYVDIHFGHWAGIHCIDSFTAIKIFLIIIFQEFIQALDNPTRDDFLVKLLSMGRGSLVFAKQLVADNLPIELTPLTDLPWCRCWVCLWLETEQEYQWCKKHQCSTSYRALKNVCLDRDILEVCLKAQCDIRADRFNFFNGKLLQSSLSLVCPLEVWQIGQREQMSPTCLCSEDDSTNIPFS